MLCAQDIQAIADSLKAAQDGVQQLAPPTSRYDDFDVPCAYAVSHRIHEARLAEGAAPLGRKIGFTNPDMWPIYGVSDPVWGHLYDSTVVQLPAGHATFSLGRFSDPKIEPEIVFHFRRAPPAGGDLAAILACIDSVAHAFEIVQTHYPDWKFKASDSIADSALHGALLLGEPQPVDRLGPGLLAALESFSLELLCDSAVCARGKGSNVLGSPVAAIAHLVEVLSRQPQFEPLRAGEWVTTGTITTAERVSPGQTWRTHLQGIALPGLSVEFTD